MDIQEQQLSPLWSFVVKYGLAVVVLTFYATVVLHFDYTPDDTYIYLQYAKNIASGNGFSFNAGTPSYGVTGPLWALLIAAGAVIKLDPYIVAKTFDLVFASIAISLVYVLAYFVVRDKRYAFVAALIFSFDSWFLRWAGSGMESSLSVLLVLLCVLYVYRNEYYLAALVAGLLTLVRPEGVLLFAVIQLDNFLNTRSFKQSFRSLLVSSSIFAIVLLPWVLFSFLYFGTIIPNTFAAKTSEGLSWTELSFVATSIVKIIGSTQAISCLALVVGFLIAWKKDGWDAVRVDIFPLLWIIALCLGYVAMKVQVVSRYLLLTTPFIVVYGLWGIKKIGERWKFSDRTTIAALAVVSILSIGVNQYVYRVHVVPHVDQFVTGMNECLKPIAYWLRENTSEGTTVLTPDVGLVGYISHRTLYDTAGLVAPAVKKAFADVTYDEGMLQQRFKKAIQPQYIIDRAPEPGRFASSVFQPVMTKRFPSLGITKSEPVYYTLYKVVQ